MTLLLVLQAVLGVLGTRTLRRWLFADEDIIPQPVLRHIQMWIDTTGSMVGSFLPSVLHADLTAAVPALAGLDTVVLSGTNDATIPCRHSVDLAGALA